MRRLFRREQHRTNGENGGNEPITSDVKVTWSHYGKKTQLQLTAQEMIQLDDVYERLLDKMRIVRPGFDDALAYEDNAGNLLYIGNDEELREAIHQQSRGHNKLKVVSVQQPPSSLNSNHSSPRSQHLHHRRVNGARSLSVPPPPTSDYREYGRPRSRLSAPSPLSPQSQSSPIPYYPNQVALRSDTPKHLDADQVYTVYGPRYTASVLYGYPPSMPWVYPLLTSPWPFGGHYRYTGPNKMIGWSGWGSGGPWASRWGYHKSGYGPVW